MITQGQVRSFWNTLQNTKWQDPYPEALTIEVSRSDKNWRG